jgi:hypothetical protein
MPPSEPVGSISTPYSLGYKKIRLATLGRFHCVRKREADLAILLTELELLTRFHLEIWTTSELCPTSMVSVLALAPPPQSSKVFLPI